MADVMIYQPYFYNLVDRIDYFKDVIQNCHINGVVLHENMSCRPSCTGMYDLKQHIQSELGIPVLLFTCDMNDPRAYSEEQMQVRIESFIEILNQSKSNLKKMQKGYFFLNLHLLFFLLYLKSFL